MTEPTTARDSRIPTVLARNIVLVDFCRQYLEAIDEIAAYNKEVIAEKSSEWNVSKVLAKARELGNPEDANTPVNEDIKKALSEWEDAVTKVNVAKRAVLEATSKELGITLSSVTVERNAETEAPLREKRKFANEIGNQLSAIAAMTRDEKSKDAVNEFLTSNPLLAVGRDQVRTFGGDEPSTPKYRVNVKVTDKDGNVLVDESGFTKTALALTKYYERGKALKQDKLREAWEKSGNTVANTVVNPVEFDDNGMHFVITKKSA